MNSDELLLILGIMTQESLLWIWKPYVNDFFFEHCCACFDKTIIETKRKPFVQTGGKNVKATGSFQY